MLNLLIITLILISAFLESYSYYKQVVKTLHTHCSKDVSTTSYFIKLVKYLVTITVLVIAKNWVGLTIEIWALCSCIVTTAIIIKHKPKEWKAW